MAEEARTPSCEARCWPPPASYEAGGTAEAANAGTRGAAAAAVDAAAIAIPGGGYCYCDAGCINKYTDNNSEGSCCADHSWRCDGGERDPLCMDARTQAQALHLFVAHHALQPKEASL